MPRLILVCLATVLIIGSVRAADIPFVFGDDDIDLSSLSSEEIERLGATLSAGIPPISEVPEGRVIELATTGGGQGSGQRHGITLGGLRRIFDLRVEPENDLIQRKALVLAAKYPGDHTIDQVCSIYHYLKDGDGEIDGWSYVGESRGEEIYRFANFTLGVGKEAGVSGAGDCDDFAILMSSLIEAIGGTTRVVLAFNSTTKIGHAYAEAYLGRLDLDEDRVLETIS
jgi:hypothetical protein